MVPVSARKQCVFAEISLPGSREKKIQVQDQEFLLRAVSFRDYSRIGLLRIDSIRVLLGAIPFSELTLSRPRGGGGGGAFGARANFEDL